MQLANFSTSDAPHLALACSDYDAILRRLHTGHQGADGHQNTKTTQCLSGADVIGLRNRLRGAQGC